MITEEELDKFEMAMSRRHPWEEVRAWIPTKVSGKWIWGRKYFISQYMFMPENRWERALDVLDIMRVEEKLTKRS